MFGKPEQLTNPSYSSFIGDRGFDNSSGYSYAAPPDEVEKTIDYFSDTEFGRLIDGRKASEVWPVIDELVSEALQAVNPRLYDAFIRKLTP